MKMSPVLRSIGLLTLLVATYRLDAQDSSVQPLSISVLDVSTGQPIQEGETIDSLDFYYQVTVTGNGKPCIGAVVGTAGANGANPRLEISPTQTQFSLNFPGIGNTYSVETQGGGIANFKITYTISAVCNFALSASGAVFQFHNLWVP